MLLCLNLLRIPLACSNLIFTSETYSIECKCSLSSAPRYITSLVGISLFPSSLNLKPCSIFNVPNNKITESILLTFRLYLFAFNSLKRLNRFLFIRLNALFQRTLIICNSLSNQQILILMLLVFQNKESLKINHQ